MSACQRIGVNASNNARQKEAKKNFEQKAAKETKGIGGWVSVIGIRRLSKSSSACQPIGVNIAAPPEPPRTMLNRRQ
jgi:hypothetical protein